MPKLSPEFLWSKKRSPEKDAAEKTQPQDAPVRLSNRSVRGCAVSIRPRANPLSGQRNDLDGLRPFLPLLDLILDALVFLQRSESLGFDAAVMREHVAATIVGLDETEALGLVEPLYNACGHSKLFIKNAGGARGAQAMSALDVAGWLGGSTAAGLRRREAEQQYEPEHLEPLTQRGHRLRCKRYLNRPQRASV
jgi:hypothetical protein